MAFRTTVNRLAAGVRSLHTSRPVAKIHEGRCTWASFCLLSGPPLFPALGNYTRVWFYKLLLFCIYLPTPHHHPPPPLFHARTHQPYMHVCTCTRVGMPSLSLSYSCARSPTLIHSFSFSCCPLSLIHTFRWDLGDDWKHAGRSDSEAGTRSRRSSRC